MRGIRDWGDPRFPTYLNHTQEEGKRLTGIMGTKIVSPPSEILCTLLIIQYDQEISDPLYLGHLPTLINVIRSLISLSKLCKHLYILCM